MEDVTLWRMSPYGACDLVAHVTLWMMSPCGRCHPMEDVTW